MGNTDEAAKKSRRGHGEGSIFQRASDGKWVATLELEPVNGKRRRKTYIGETKKAVAAQLSAGKAQSDKGAPPSTTRITLQDHLDSWVAQVSRTRKPQTVTWYRSIIEERIKPHIGRKHLAKLTPATIRDFYMVLQDQPSKKTGKPLSPQSIRHTHQVLHLALQQAVKEGTLSHNPCSKLAKDTLAKVERADLNVWNAEQVKTFLQANRSDDSYALWVLAVTSGMRQGELLGLRWSDVNLETRKVMVRQTLQRRTLARKPDDRQRKDSLAFGTPKTTNSRRTIKISRLAAEALKEHRKKQVAARLQSDCDWGTADIVFCNPRDGSPLDPSWQIAVLKEAVKKAKLPPIRFHDLRHTAATLQFSKGTDVKTVSDMLGHATTGITYDVYTHYVPQKHDEAADAMDALLAV